MIRAYELAQRQSRITDLYNQQLIEANMTVSKGEVKTNFFSISFHQKWIFVSLQPGWLFFVSSELPDVELETYKKSKTLLLAMQYYNEQYLGGTVRKSQNKVHTQRYIWELRNIFFLNLSL